MSDEIDKTRREPRKPNATVVIARGQRNFYASIATVVVPIVPLPTELKWLGRPVMAAGQGCGACLLDRQMARGHSYSRLRRLYRTRRLIDGNDATVHFAALDPPRWVQRARAQSLAPPSNRASRQRMI